MSAIVMKTVALIALFGLSLVKADFSGTYEAVDEGEKTILTLQQSGDKVTGTAKVEDAELTVEATVSGDTMTGTAKYQALLTLHLKGTLTKEGISMKIAEDSSFSDAETVVFKRTSGGAGATESEKTQKVETGTDKYSNKPSEILRSGKEYTHASGGKFRYPAGWRVQEGEGYVQLVPPDAKEGELIIIKAESAAGATDPGSEEILAYLDGQVTESVPDARREGKPEKSVAGAGKGVILNWNGTVEGRKSLIRGYVTIVKNYGVALVAIGSKETVESRDKDLRQIFQSIGWGQGKVDQQLVGSWNYWGYKGSSDGKYGREEKVQCTLNADGTFTYNNSSETSISASGTDAGGNQTWAGGMNARRGNGWSGTWTADGSTIILNFEDGSSESFRYRFEQQGQNVFLVTEDENGKNKMEWSRR